MNQSETLLHLHNAVLALQCCTGIGIGVFHLTPEVVCKIPEQAIVGLGVVEIHVFVVVVVVVGGACSPERMFLSTFMYCIACSSYHNQPALLTYAKHWQHHVQGQSFQ